MGTWFLTTKNGIHLNTIPLLYLKLEVYDVCLEFFARTILLTQSIRNCLDEYVKVNESRHKQRGVTPHFSTGQNLLKKIFRKDKY